MKELLWNSLKGRQSTRNCIFDGKIGIGPFVEKVPAQKNSKNRPKGTLVTQPLAVDKKVYKDFIINKLLPAARAKWPQACTTIHIGIQQDNPNTHFKEGDREWEEAANSNCGIKFHLREQPPNSPDTNILDLGFFRSLQTDYYKLKRGRSLDSIIENVLKAFKEYDPKKLERIWITHQSVCNQILMVNGSNDYDIPHLGKDSMEKGDNLPASLVASARAVQMAKEVVEI
eukprot:scaffold11518_cov123-Amphora_coffeaeformis.AAC.1